MKALTVGLCVALGFVLTACRWSYHTYRHTSTSTSSFSSSTTTNGNVQDEEFRQSVTNTNGHTTSSYFYKREGYSYNVTSNGPLKIEKGAVQKLRSNQTVDLVLTEAGKDYHYVISKAAFGTTVNCPDGAVTDVDEARIRTALEHVEKRSGHK